MVTQAAIGPSAEVCNGLDDDCDAAADDDIADLVTGTDVGECQTEIQLCQGGQFVVTQAAIGPSAEVCNGLDNDCNATVDDQPAADDSCSEGVVCTVDACVAGSCTNTPSDALCSAGETCDGTACVPAVVPCCQQALDAAGWDAPGFVTIDVECQQDGDYHETRTPSSGPNIFFQLVPDTTSSLPRTAFINNGPGTTVECPLGTQSELDACALFYTDPSAAIACVPTP